MTLALQKALGHLVSELEDNEVSNHERFGEYQFEPARYIEDHLGWKPWGGEGDWVGQLEVLDAYARCLVAQHEKLAFDAGEIGAEELTEYVPGEPIKNRIRVQAGHGVGKSKLASGIISHFFDCFVPSIGYVFAPNYAQINDLIFKEIRADRRAHNLPGHVLERPEIKHSEKHFVKGRATNNQKTEGVQGQHEKYMSFVLDEAEGIPAYVWDAIDSMASGGIAVVLMLANPRSRTSSFHKAAKDDNCVSFRMSCLAHPNVLAGYEVIPNAVQRSYVDTMIAKHCEVVPQHDEDKYTFELPWASDGKIYLPDDEFLFRVMGVPPISSLGNTFCPSGRYEAALAREEPLENDYGDMVHIGVDCARYGSDFGSIFMCRGGIVSKEAGVYKQSGWEYYVLVKGILEQLRDEGCLAVSVRVDGGGGYGSTLIDNLNNDSDVWDWFEDFSVIEVHNNGVPYDADEYYDMITELYHSAGELMSVVSLRDVPEQLQVDLCERVYKQTLKSGREVKRIESKEAFRDRIGRSPDDGDAFVLAVAPNYLFHYTNIQLGFA